MAKNQTYHESAVRYNEELAAFAESLAPTLEDPDIRKWCVGVGRQHRFHENRHRAALAKILAREATTVEVEQIPDGLDVPELTGDEETDAILSDPDTMSAIAEAEAEEPDLSPSVEEDSNTQSDGCGKFHTPVTNPNCEMIPKVVI